MKPKKLSVRMLVTVTVDAETLCSGRPITAGWVEREVRSVLRDEFDDEGSVRVQRLPDTARAAAKGEA